MPCWCQGSEVRLSKSKTTGCGQQSVVYLIKWPVSDTMTSGSLAIPRESSCSEKTFRPDRCTLTADFLSFMISSLSVPSVLWITFRKKKCFKANYCGPFSPQLSCFAAVSCAALLGVISRKLLGSLPPKVFCGSQSVMPAELMRTLRQIPLRHLLMWFRSPESRTSRRMKD